MSAWATSSWWWTADASWSPRGSSLFYHGNVAHECRNETVAVCEFYVVIDGTGAC